LVGRRGLLGAAASEALNGFVYWIALPALLFVAMAKVPLDAALHGRFLATYLGGAVVSFVAATAIGAAFPNRLAGRTLQGLAAVFGNTGYLGIPLFIAAFGPDGALPAVLATAVNSALGIGTAILLIEFDLSPAGSLRRIARDVFRALSRNPLVLAPLLGLAVAMLRVPLPTPLTNLCSLLGAAAAPAALMSLGLFLVGTSWSAGVAEVGWITLVKLVLQPLLTWLLARCLLPGEPIWAAASVLLAALPTGSLVFTVAQRYRVYVERASSAVLVTTLVSVATISLLLLLLQPS
jgi:hypothetical protein